jgi:SAM-dependent methyltransferase
MASESPYLFGDRRRASSFGDDAEQYDRVRPSYPRALIDHLMTERPTTVLDVGCGTGITSRLLEARGCDVVGLEPDARMASVARRHGTAVESGTFEDWDAGSRRFDLLMAGQAWHWVDPHVGASKAAEVLHPGGRIGLFWNQSNPTPEINEALRRAYLRCAPELAKHSVLLGQRDRSLYAAIADAVRATSRFEMVSMHWFDHEATYPTETWLELSATHSDHRTLPPDQLAELLAALRTEIDQCGGRVPVRYETTMVTGRTLGEGRP